MSEQLRESMSAAFDDEADAFELRRVLDEAAADEELRAQWHRLHLMRDVLRGDDHLVRQRLRSTLFAELNNSEETPQASSVQLQSIEGGMGKPGRSNWLGRATGVLVATAAAVLVMVNGGLFSDDPVFENPGDSLAGVEINNSQELVPVMYSQATPADRRRQYGFMLRHIQQNAMTSNAVASFAKMATFEREDLRAADVAEDGQDEAVSNADD